MNKDFSYYIKEYFTTYLPKQRNVSNRTQENYYYSFIVLFEYFKKKDNVNSNEIRFELFSKSKIESFLLWLSTDRKNNDGTCNLRLAAIQSFFRFLLNKEEFNYFDLCSSILSIKYKKTPQHIVTYMSIEETKILFSKINTNMLNEFRDFTILSLLYFTGIRVSELINIKIEDIILNDNSQVTIYGKGNKIRIIPLDNDMRKILEKYIKLFSISNDSYLFKTRLNKRMSRDAVADIISKYIKRAKIEYPELFQKKITPHSFRHSRAMHLLEEGVDLIYIRDLLGHTSVLTTEIYARTNPEIKRKILEENWKYINQSKKYTCKQKDDLLNWCKNNINSLKK